MFSTSVRVAVKPEWVAVLGLQRSASQVRLRPRCLALVWIVVAPQPAGVCRDPAQHHVRQQDR